MAFTRAGGVLGFPPTRPTTRNDTFPPERSAVEGSDATIQRSHSNSITSVDLGHGVRSASPSAQTHRRSQSVSTAQPQYQDHGSDVTTPDSRDERSRTNSVATYETDATSIRTLPALQTKGPAHEYTQLEPVAEDDPTSYDLLTPAVGRIPMSTFSLESRADQMFSTEHLQAIFNDPPLLLKFTSFLGTHRPASVPILIYYLDALKALRAIKYANAVAEALDPLEHQEFTSQTVPSTANAALEEKAKQAFQVLVEQDLPAYITDTWVRVVSTSIHRRITGTLPPHLREASEGLAEVFCLSDPSRPDNPIVFASEEFHRTTQYGMSYALGRNCRFLQGPRTNPASVRRLAEAVKAGRDHCETFINYRRDGSPFMNLLMIAPLRDSRGTLRYHIGAQVDVSGLAKECTHLEALQGILADQNEEQEEEEEQSPPERKDEFQELSEMFNIAELDIVRKYGGRMHREHVEEKEDVTFQHRPRLLLKNLSAEELDTSAEMAQETVRPTIHGKLSGVYQNYLLVRPYPSLRILFASPSLRVPGILQSPFMNRIGGSERVREELVAALADGRGVTAKIRWTSRNDEEGRNRWVHCTPLMGSNGSIGVWMVVLVDDESSRAVRRFRPAPPVSSEINGRTFQHRPATAMSTRRSDTPAADDFDFRIR